MINDKTRLKNLLRRAILRKEGEDRKVRSTQVNARVAEELERREKKVNG